MWSVVMQVRTEIEYELLVSKWEPQDEGEQGKVALRQGQVESHTNVDRQVRGLPIEYRRRQVTRQGEGRIRNMCR